MKKAALDYLSLGLTPIPCKLENSPDGRVNKKPLVPWREFENRHPTRSEIETWFSAQPCPHVGLVTGTTSGIFVIDVDNGHNPDDLLALRLPPTAVARTPSGGFHYYFSYPTGRRVKTIAGLRPKIDVRGEGGFVVAPPSTYPDGRPYEWLLSILDSPPPEAPEPLLALVTAPEERERVDLAPIMKGVGLGARNASAAQLSGLLLRYLPSRTWNDVVWPLLRAWNAKNRPPMDEIELLTVMNSIAQKEMRRRDSERELEEQITQKIS